MAIREKHDQKVKKKIDDQLKGLRLDILRFIHRIEEVRFDSFVDAIDGEDLENTFDECIGSVYVVLDALEVLCQAASDGELRPLKNRSHLRLM